MPETFNLADTDSRWNVVLGMETEISAPIEILPVEVVPSSTQKIVGRNLDILQAYTLALRMICEAQGKLVVITGQKTVIGEMADDGLIGNVLEPILPEVPEKDNPFAKAARTELSIMSSVLGRYNRREPGDILRSQDVSAFMESTTALVESIVKKLIGK